MSDFVETIDELQRNISKFKIELDNDTDDFSCKTTRDVLKRGRKFLVIENGDKYIFCPVRYAAYKNITAKEYDRRYREGSTEPGNDLLNGTKAEQAIKKLFKKRKDFFINNDSLDQIYKTVCHDYGFEPYNINRSYYTIKLKNNAEEKNNHIAYPDEFEDTSDGLTEGALQRIMVNRYERDPEARKKCIEHYGTACMVCGFDFEKRYGSIGLGFIHVHHLFDIASIGEKHQVDPVVDLRPVCPNCHAMLHQERPAMSIEKLKQFLRE